jgi:hypothetical protein
MTGLSQQGWIRSIRVDPCTREEIIAELSSHLEESYEDFCQQGLSEPEALQRSLEGIPWWPLSRKIQSAKCKETLMNERTRQFWLPALVSLTISEGVLLGLSFIIATHPYLWRMGPAVLYGPGYFPCQRRELREPISRDVPVADVEHCLRLCGFPRLWVLDSYAQAC